jgi:hypothetical protein
VAAARPGRHFLGYDTDDAYAKAARARVAEAQEAVLAAPPAPMPDSASGAAAELLASAGFTVADAATMKRRRFAGGVAVDWAAVDAAGREWLVLVAGAGTVARRGLSRTDVLYRTLGEASILQATGAPVLVLTTDLPPARSALAKALATARGGPIVDALALGGRGVEARLAGYAAGGATGPIGELLPG